MILFSGGIPALDAAAITRVSPLKTSLTIPLNHVADERVILDDTLERAVVRELSD